VHVHSTLQTFRCRDRRWDGIGQLCCYTPLPDNKLRYSWTKATDIPGEISLCLTEPEFPIAKKSSDEE